MYRFIPVQAALLLSSAFVVPEAMAQSPFPDLYGEPINKTISFWKNQGQEIDTEGNGRNDVKFISDGTQPKVYLRDKSTVSLAFGMSSGENEMIDQLARIDVTAVGQHAISTVPAGLILKDYVKHYWLEHTMPDPVLNVPGYGWIKYTSVYPGIDWHWYGGSSGTKMAFVCQPGSDPQNITLRFSGQDSLKLDWQGALKIHLQQKWLKFEEAKAYQYDVFGNITLLSWGASYELVDGQPQVKFYYSNYDPAKPLVFFVGFPPVNMGGGPNDNIPYSTYLGTGMKDEVNEIAVAANGDYYTVGDIEDHQFPATVGLVPSWASNQTGFIAKFDANYVRKWVGYYGRKLSSIALDEANQRIIVGASRNSSLFTQQFGNGYLLAQGGGCAIAMISFETETTPPGLLWSTRWTASTLTKVLVDREGRIYVAGSVYQSYPYVVQPPTGTNPFYQPTHHGQYDGYIACSDANTNLVWSTLYGGEGEDQILDMAIHEGINRLAVVGRTNSAGHPGGGNCMVQNGWFPQCGGGGAYNQVYCNSNGQNCSTKEDGFIGMFALNLDWTWSTLFGGPSNDRITSVAFSPSGEVYVAGYIASPQTYSSNSCGVPGPNAQGFPYCVWTQAADQDFYAGKDEHFIARFGTDRILNWSRFVGGPGYEFASHLTSVSNDTYPVHGPLLAVDDAGDIYMVGSTTSGGSTYGNGYIITQQNSQYYQNPYNNGFSEPPPTDRSDVYVMKMNGGSGEVVYGAFYGGRSGVPLNWPGWSLNQDVATCVTVRGSRLFIGGSTASILFFPVNAADGIAASFQQLTPPANQVAGATDLTHGFIAQLSWLFDPVGIDAPEVRDPVIVAAFGGDGQLTLQLSGEMPQGRLVVDLFDAQGKLAGSFAARSAQAMVMLPTAHLSAGLYVGRVRDTYIAFKAAKP